MSIEQLMEQGAAEQRRFVEESALLDSQPHSISEWAREQLGTILTGIDEEVGRPDAGGESGSPGSPATPED